MPTRPEERTKFIQDHRAFRLTGEFARDLHLRIFRAFASLGFDDEGWYSDEDLKWLIDEGSKEVGTLKASITAEKSKAEASGSTAKSSLEKQLETLEKKIAPFRAELELRDPSAYVSPH